jgi:hypothetical protein
MTRFTDSPYERMMTQKQEAQNQPQPPALPEDHPCYGCGNYGRPCVGICIRELLRWKGDPHDPPADH